MKKCKLLKKVSVLATLVMMLGSIPITSYAETATDSNAEKNSKMDILDLNIAAATCLNSEHEDEKCISGDTYLENTVPLFDTNGKKIAYYVTFSPKGYAVINNNVNNPAVIEFGDDKNPLIEDILEKNSDAHIIYNNPSNLYEKTNGITSSSSQSSFFDYYPELKESDSALVDQHNKFKKSYLENTQRGNGDYGFINVEDLPYGSYITKTIKSAASVDWAIMDDYNDIANKHCGATAVTNLALYFAHRGKSDLKIDGSKRTTFIAVHDIVGDGPSITIAKNAKNYFKTRGYSLKYSRANEYDEFKEAIKKNHPCGVLLENSITDWHWILSIGYRSYFDKFSKYMRIVDGWNNSANRYYKINSAWMSATAYSVD